MLLVESVGYGVTAMHVANERRSTTRSVRDRVAEKRRATVTPKLDALIEKMALSPDVNLEALERVLRYQQRTIRDTEKKAFDGAFSALQLSLPVLSENGEIRDRSGKLQHRYALWEDVNEIIKPILAAHGFALWFRTEDDGNRIAVTAILSHLGGHAEETTLRLPSDLSGGKNLVQAIGSSTSYGKRYAASALLNLTSRGEDDDGKSAGRTEAVSPEQLDSLRALMGEVGADEEKLVAYFKVEALEELPASRYKRAIDAIKLKGGRS